MKHINVILVFDWIVIILGMSYGVSMLMQVFCVVPSVGNILPYTAFLVFSHVLRFGMRISFFKLISTYKLLLLLWFIYIFDFVQAMFLDSKSTGTAFSRIVISVFYLSYLFNVYKEKGYEYLIKPYIGYALYNVVAIMLMAILILLGVSWQQNPLSVHEYALLGNHHEYSYHFFPYFLCMASEFHEISIFPFFPGLTGLAHEPHVIMFTITPGIFFLYTKINSNLYKILLIASFVFIFLETLSTTAILCVGGVFLSHLSWQLLYNKQQKYAFATVLVIGIALPLLYNTINTLIQVATMKMEGSSSDYSQNMLSYIVTWTDIFGYGNYPSSEGEYADGVHIGLITGLMDIILYISLILMTLKLTLAKDEYAHYMGLGFMYFLVHGLKLGYNMFVYSLFEYLILMLCIYCMNQKNIYYKESNASDGI